MPVKLAARLLYDEWKSRPAFDWSYWGADNDRDSYLSFLKSQAQDSATDGHRAYKLALRWISEL